MKEVHFAFYFYFLNLSSKVFFTFHSCNCPNNISLPIDAHLTNYSQQGSMLGAIFLGQTSLKQNRNPRPKEIK
uniref:Uncharacterized protein n=1 Tax=Rhizophora mucronata TaxID=61149 RepID=A0A2P2KYD9_RHIMU